MRALELVAGYPAAWRADKLKRPGRRLNGEAGKVMGGGLTRFHDVVVGKLGTELALARLDADVACWLEPGDRPRRQAQDAVEEAAEAGPAFAANVQELLAELDEARNGGPAVSGIDLRGASGVQVGNCSPQTGTFR